MEPENIKSVIRLSPQEPNLPAPGTSALKQPLQQPVKSWLDVSVGEKSETSGIDMSKNSIKGNSGFTLIEMMITVAIIAILASIAYPAYTEQIRKGKRSECRSGLMQSMQQQERYYTQFNEYVAFSLGATTAKTQSFSGDSLAASACSIAAVQCTSSTTTQALNQCIELQASMRSGNDPVSLLYMTSNGDKGCTYNGTTRVTTEKQCWP
jgi:type IV pilus assembly protein PilE